MVEGGDFLECWQWFCRKYDDIKDAGKPKRWIVCGLWRIWKCGDSVIFEKLALEPRVALELLHQGVRLRSVQTGQGGFGWVARLVFKEAGGAGNFLCESSLMADVEAIRAALLACVEKGFGIVQFETNSKVMVDMLNGVLQPNAVIEGILWDI
ncbi:ribonuclease H protein [Pyrus ussuriensis x Pyrus communis]|uniref:Ribonuclease H protein n=1 Tax=Pyrus ussuriensis x Pyrus communis TaxID=2448454 RepID=A0A5N5EWR4_9ROSA|nr:ribonuclease H protein [Pyrus ussuriensis x Pyrus communis]